MYLVAGSPCFEDAGSFISICSSLLRLVIGGVCNVCAEQMQLRLLFLGACSLSCIPFLVGFYLLVLPKCLELLLEALLEGLSGRIILCVLLK